VAPEIVNLLMKLPFEEVMEIATRQGVTVHYDAKRGDYHCEYVVDSGTSGTIVSVAPQQKIKLAVANAIVGCVEAKV